MYGTFNGVQPVCPMPGYFLGRPNSVYLERYPKPRRNRRRRTT